MPEKKPSKIYFVAKRKYWVEWHLHFEKFPEGNALENAEKLLKEYIEKYLREYFKRKCDDGNDKSIQNDAVPKSITDNINGFFGDNPPDPKSTQPGSNKKVRWIVEAAEWKDNGWKELTHAEHDLAVKDNTDNKTAPKRKLSYTVYSEEWIYRLRAKLDTVTESQNVYVYRALFEGLNHIRLTDDENLSENKGTMNPPQPPQPPNNAAVSS